MGGLAAHQAERRLHVAHRLGVIPARKRVIEDGQGITGLVEEVLIESALITIGPRDGGITAARAGDDKTVGGSAGSGQVHLHPGTLHVHHAGIQLGNLLRTGLQDRADGGPDLVGHLLHALHIGVDVVIGDGGTVGEDHLRIG